MRNIFYVTQNRFWAENIQLVLSYQNISRLIHGSVIFSSAGPVKRALVVALVFRLELIRVFYVFMSLLVYLSAFIRIRHSHGYNPAPWCPMYEYTKYKLSNTFYIISMVEFSSHSIFHTWRNGKIVHSCFYTSTHFVATEFAKGCKQKHDFIHL